jgi:hypothetical protein
VFQEAEHEMRHIDELMDKWNQGADVSVARYKFEEKAEAAINEQVWAGRSCGNGGGLDWSAR